MVCNGEDEKEGYAHLLAECFLSGALFCSLSGGKERHNEKESKSPRSAVSVGIGLKESKLEE